jgi:hypothetical protein
VALKLPHERDLERFATLGPTGKHVADINGRAAAIECYLDLPADACVRWTSFSHKIGEYQGELINKERYASAFLDQRYKLDGYRYDKIDAVLELIVASAIAMRERSTAEVYAELYEDRLQSL